MPDIVDTLKEIINRHGNYTECIEGLEMAVAEIERLRRDKEGGSRDQGLEEEKDQESKDCIDKLREQFFESYCGCGKYTCYRCQNNRMIFNTLVERLS